MTYLALVQGDWSLSSEDIGKALLRDWPGIDVFANSRAVLDPARVVVWCYESTEQQVEGSVDQSGKCIYLDGQEEPVAKFVAWYRSIVPSDRTVIFCDDEYSFDFVVEPGSSWYDIVLRLPTP